ncbi:MAG TPA: hypothetical protein VK031_02660 [Tissierellaceae bacterium]|nr:hypothetical protein [Tissierellaceae bacterium]
MTDNDRIIRDLLIELGKRREEDEQHIKNRIEELKNKIIESKPYNIDLEFTLDLLIDYSKVLGVYESSSGER